MASSSSTGSSSTDPTSKEVVGVVLAGGASRRMGRDKAKVELGGKSLVEHAADKLSQVAHEVLVADRGRGVAPGYRSIADGPGGGPVAGILGAAQAFAERPLLVLACDLPTVPVELLERLVATPDPSDGIRAERHVEDARAPRWARGIEPLCAFYRPTAIAALIDRVRGGKFALHDLLTSGLLKVHFLEGSMLAAWGPPERIFLNLNTPTDLARLGHVTCEPVPTKID